MLTAMTRRGRAAALMIGRAMWLAVAGAASAQPASGVGRKPLWQAVDTSGDSPASLAVSPDGRRVFVIGDGTGNMRVAGYDAGTGAGLWIDSISGTGTPSD